MTGLSRVGIAGAGAFGTALALVAARAGREAVLWTRARAEALRATRESDALPGVPIPAVVEITADLAALGGIDLLLLAAPAQATRGVAASLAGSLPQGLPVIACAKGIESATGLRQSEVIAATLPGVRPAALSGPGFAGEIARGLPTAVTVAAADLPLAQDLCRALSSGSFRAYASDDLIGVELGGAAKNVLAIACGIVAGRGLGESARAALIARGLAEMMRLGAALGARAETFMGLSGLGDLVLTATSPQSRNTRFGMALAGGLAVDAILAEGRLVEGAYTATILAEIARDRGVEAPIIAAVAAVLAGATSVDAAIAALVTRPLRPEVG